MNKTEVSIRLRLPLGKEQCESCKDKLKQVLEAQPELQKVMLFDDGEEERISISFLYEEPISLDAIVAQIAEEGATASQIVLQLPSSLSGIGSIHDTRNYGANISGMLQDIDGVQYAGVSSNMVLRIQIDTDAPDATMEKATNRLMRWKQEHGRGKTQNQQPS